MLPHKGGALRSVSFTSFAERGGMTEGIYRDASLTKRRTMKTLKTSTAILSRVVAVVVLTLSSVLTAEAAPGCTTPQACNFDPSATEDDGSCDYSSCLGCTYATALNYDATAVIDDGSCTFAAVVEGCTNATATNYDAAATLDDGSCQFAVAVLGCTYLDALNYDATAQEDDGTCQFELCNDDCAADLNNDGLVNASDLSLFLTNFGSVCN